MIILTIIACFIISKIPYTPHITDKIQFNNQQIVYAKKKTEFPWERG